MADTKISDMTAATELDRADLVAVVQDVATTPVNRNATLDVLDPGRTLGGSSAAVNRVAVGDATATRASDFAAGHDAVADAENDTGFNSSIAVGYAASAVGIRSVAVGAQADCTGGEATVVGSNAVAQVGCTALGAQTDATDRDSVAVGTGAQATADSSVSVGNGSDASEFGAIAIGNAVIASGSGATAVGDRSDATGDYDTALGYQAQATGTGTDGAVAIGDNADCAHSSSVALGANSTTTATDQVMVGPRDIEITGTDKGIVLEDRTLGTRHRVYLDNGTLEIEAA